MDEYRKLPDGTIIKLREFGVLSPTGKISNRLPGTPLLIGTTLPPSPRTCIRVNTGPWIELTDLKTTITVQEASYVHVSKRWPNGSMRINVYEDDEGTLKDPDIIKSDSLVFLIPRNLKKAQLTWIVDVHQLVIDIVPWRIDNITPGDAKSRRLPGNSFECISDDCYTATLTTCAPVKGVDGHVDTLVLHVDPQLISMLPLKNDATTATMLQKYTSTTTKSGSSVLLDLMRRCVPTSLVCPNFLLWMVPVLQDVPSKYVAIQFAPLEPGTSEVGKTEFNMDPKQTDELFYQLRFSQCEPKHTRHTTTSKRGTGAGAGAGAGSGSGSGSGEGSDDEDDRVEVPVRTSAQKSMFSGMSAKVVHKAEHAKTGTLTERRRPEPVEPHIDTTLTTPVLQTVEAHIFTLIDIPSCVNVSVMLSLVCSNIKVLVIDTYDVPTHPVVLPPMPQLDVCTVGKNCSGSIHAGHLQENVSLSLVASSTTLDSVLAVIAECPVKNIELTLAGGTFAIPEAAMLSWKLQNQIVSILLNPTPENAYVDSIELKNLLTFSEEDLRRYIRERCHFSEEVQESICNTRNSIETTECGASLVMYRFQ